MAGLAGHVPVTGHVALPVVLDIAVHLPQDSVQGCTGSDGVHLLVQRDEGGLLRVGFLIHHHNLSYRSLSIYY